MKLSFLSLALVGFTCFTSIGQNRSIVFEHGTFAEIKAKALKENKLVFIDAYTTWCGPCKHMAKTVFTNDTVADYFNKNFVNAKMDMEKGEGIEIAKQYQVQCYPNLLFIDGKGNLIHRTAGSLPAKDFIAFAEETKIPEKQFAYFSNNYESNKTNPEFLAKYISAREGTCLESREIVKDYFSLQKDADLSSKANWNMIVNHINDVDSREFKYLIANRKQFDDLYTSKSVDEKIESVNENRLYTILRTKPFNKSKYEETKKSIEQLRMPNTKRLFFESDLNLSEMNQDWITYSKLAVDNVDQFYFDKSDALNNMAWSFYEKVSDKDALAKAESWAKRACELDKSYANLDTYAAILYKEGKKTHALEVANAAIDQAKKQQLSAADYQGTVDLLNNIKALK
ncbi:MAG: thiol:disulfide interchange protein [Bacteroidota bacterium]|jgi:thioredoxin-related protein|nr:thiol:disulfide interchange protein [Bacteroidota bacterium]